MLRIFATKGPSEIHELGLIAREFIPAGAVVWEFMPGFDLEISPDLFMSLSASAQDCVRYYGWINHKTGCYRLSADDDRFTNHSDDPNTIIQGDHTIAARDILMGEEITFDYRLLPGQDHVPNRD
jgi:SET domain-containing protein